MGEVQWELGHRGVFEDKDGHVSGVKIRIGARMGLEYHQSTRHFDDRVGNKSGENCNVRMVLEVIHRRFHVLTSWCNRIYTHILTNDGCKYLEAHLIRH